MTTPNRISTKNATKDSADEMRLPMVIAGELKDADWKQDITCNRRVAKDRVVHSRNGYRARPEGIGCIAMNARSPGAGLGHSYPSWDRRVPSAKRLISIV